MCKEKYMNTKTNKLFIMSYETYVNLTRAQFSSVTQSCPTLCDTMDCRTPCLPVHHQLPKLA